jgi:ssDNA-binding Zn-finger/Zn-ribbon topoisomerase 1
MEGDTKKKRKTLWLCPVCGEPMIVVYTHNKNGSVVIRKRKCTNQSCKQTMHTIEKKRLE